MNEFLRTPSGAHEPQIQAPQVVRAVIDMADIKRRLRNPAPAGIGANKRLDQTGMSQTVYADPVFIRIADGDRRSAFDAEKGRANTMAPVFSVLNGLNPDTFYAQYKVFGSAGLTRKEGGGDTLPAVVGGAWFVRHNGSKMIHRGDLVRIRMPQPGDQVQTGNIGTPSQNKRLIGVTEPADPRDYALSTSLLNAMVAARREFIAGHQNDPFDADSAPGSWGPDKERERKIYRHIRTGLMHLLGVRSPDTVPQIVAPAAQFALETEVLDILKPTVQGDGKDGWRASWLKHLFTGFMDMMVISSRDILGRALDSMPVASRNEGAGSLSIQYVPH